MTIETKKVFPVSTYVYRRLTKLGLKEIETVRFINKDLHRSINRRGDLADAIAKYAINGVIWVRVWQRDCDCTEWTTKVKIPATLQGWRDLDESMGMNAEGLYHLAILERPEEFQAHVRDRILEARENGSNYFV